MEVKKTTVDITPTWVATVSMLIELIKNGNLEGQKAARAELHRMGKIIDGFNEVDWDVILAAAVEGYKATADEKIPAAVNEARRVLTSEGR